MPCLDLKKLLPHRKVWKMLTNKLMMRFKANKKRKHKTKSPYKTFSPSIQIQPTKFKRKPTLIHRHRCFQNQAPVFVDHLFVEPISVVTEHVIPDNKSSQILKRPQCGEGSEIMVGDSGDEVWESMVLASPQINERADEFIARFRAQMNHQEMLARRF